MNEGSERSDVPNAGDSSPVQLRYFAVLFAVILWGSVFGLALLSVYFKFRLNWSASILALLLAAFFTIFVIVARKKRVLSSKEVLRLTALCFLAHWLQDVLFPFVYKWKTRGEVQDEPLVMAVTVATAFALTWIALATANGVRGEFLDKRPVA